MAVDQSKIFGNLKECLLSLRQDNEWSQEELANRTGVSLMTIRRYEAMKPSKNLDINFLDRVSTLMGVPFWQLLDRILGRGSATAAIGTEKDEPTFFKLLRSGDSAIIADLGKIQTQKKSAIANEILHIAEVFLKSGRLEQLELLLDIYRKALADESLSRVDHAMMREYIATKMTEYRKELSK